MKKFIITEANLVEIKQNPDRANKNILAEGGDFMQVSDGYHTMDELYHHRIVLWITLCSLMRDRNAQGGMAAHWEVWRSKLHSDGTAFEGWFVLGLGKSKGEQMTYHLPLSEWNQTEFAETLDKAPEFDGHTADDVILRLTKLLK